MTYRGLFWLFVAVAILGLLLLAIANKVSHPQPVYEHYQGSGETPRRVRVITGNCISDGQVFYRV